jgi:hypothetical protein
VDGQGKRRSLQLIPQPSAQNRLRKRWLRRTLYDELLELPQERSIRRAVASEVELIYKLLD